MALYTPVPRVEVGNTTTELSTRVGKSKQIVVDTTKHTAVVMDGVTPGGHPLVKESRKIKADGKTVTINGGSEADLSDDITIDVAMPGVITGRTIQTDLSSQEAASLDGTENVSAGVTGVLPIEHGGTGSSEKNFVDLVSNQNISGTKTFTKSIVFESEAPSLKFTNTDVIKGTRPAENKYMSINFYDSTGVNTVLKRLGSISNGLTTAGRSYVDVIAYRNVKDLTEYASLSIIYDEDGTKYATAPTPAASANDTKIATTAWVRSFSATLANPSSTPIMPVPRTGTDEEGNEVPIALTTEELFESLRVERNLRLLRCDGQIAYLNRKLRRAESGEEKDAIAKRIAALDAYAELLCDLPDQDGAPWDGGGELTPWPIMQDVQIVGAAEPKSNVVGVTHAIENTSDAY